MFVIASWAGYRVQKSKNGWGLIRLQPNQYFTASDYAQHSGNPPVHNAGCDADQSCRRIERTAPHRGPYYYRCGTVGGNPDFCAVLGVDLILNFPNHYRISYSTNNGSSYTIINNNIPITNTAQITYAERNSNLFTYFQNNQDLLYKFEIYNSSNELLETVYYHTQL